MNYDASKYRALGVGETIIEGDVFPDDSTPGRVIRCGACIGEVVSGEELTVFLRPLTPTITKDTYPSGAARSAAEGRGRFDLIPYEAMLCYAKRLEEGVDNGHEPRNWEKGMPLSRCLSSMRRHASQVSYDYSENHLGAVLFNAGAFITMVERIRAGILPKELDDIGYFMNEEATKQ
jgi:hypothetical protein